jgi:hypothetical protein
MNTDNTGNKFVATIELTQLFVSQLQNNQLPPAQITEFVQELVATKEGARGFFVGYLTSDADIVDRPAHAIIQGLKAHLEIVADLLAKNLAMSSAQSLHFQENNQPEMAAKSAKIAKRSRQLMEMLDLPLT